MCRFITAVVPADTDFQASRSLLDKYGMSFEEVRNSSVEAQLDGDRYVRATRSACDCDSVLGSAAIRREEMRAPETDFVEIGKLQKKGWSQHKIERWISEKSAHSERHQGQALNSQDAELARWREFVSTFLSSGFAKRLGILMHMYSGRLEDEQIRIKRIERLSLSKELDHELLGMDEDVLYMVSKS
jgi:hypothetical protein